VGEVTWLNKKQRKALKEKITRRRKLPGENLWSDLSNQDLKSLAKALRERPLAKKTIDLRKSDDELKQYIVGEIKCSAGGKALGYTSRIDSESPPNHTSIQYKMTYNLHYTTQINIPFSYQFGVDSGEIRDGIYSVSLPR
jgi:hypothetical protein